MNAAIEILHKLMVPVLGAICFISIKKLVDRRLPSLHDASDLAWCLIMMSVGAMMVNSEGWTAVEYEAKVAAVIFLGLLLITNRRLNTHRLGQDGPVASRGPSGLARVVGNWGELLVGLTAVIVTSA